MSRLGFLYDQTRCIGCNACQMACKDRHNLEMGLFFRRVETLEYDGYCVHFSGACNHCGKAACVDACPTGAMGYREDGTVAVDSKKCIGCGTCTWACPYGVPKLSHKRGICQKCDACADLRAQGENPACVDACLTHCLKFGEVDEAPDKGWVRDLPFLPDSSRTAPSLWIRRKE